MPFEKSLALKWAYKQVEVAFSWLITDVGSDNLLHCGGTSCAKIVLNCAHKHVARSTLFSASVPASRFQPF